MLLALFLFGAHAPPPDATPVDCHLRYTPVPKHRMAARRPAYCPAKRPQLSS